MILLNYANFDDIESLWKNHVRESINLEFKTDLGTNNDEIAKDISSMANAEGGIIIYGLQENSTTGTASKSDGIVLDKKNEKIQQIVSSVIAPELQISIHTVNSMNGNDIIENKGFIVVEIPKSEYYIHQVTSKGKFYVRMNTTTTKYESLQLNESDIASRYSKRFENKKRIENTFVQKLRNYIEELQTNEFVFLGMIPNVLPSFNTKITKQIFNELISSNRGDGTSHSSNQFYYNSLTESDFFFSNKPHGNGRLANGHDRMILEINDDGTAYCFNNVKNSGDDFISSLYTLADYLHLIKRLLSRLNYFGTVLINYQIALNFPLDMDGEIILSTDTDAIAFRSRGNYLLKEISLSAPIHTNEFDISEYVTKTFSKILEHLGIDDAGGYYDSFIRQLHNAITEMEIRLENIQ